MKYIYFLFRIVKIIKETNNALLEKIFLRLKIVGGELLLKLYIREHQN